MKRLSVIILFLHLFDPVYAQNVGSTIYTLDQVLLADPDTIYAISLSKQKLDTLPKELGRFKHLKYLDLSKNKLSKLPDFIVDFKGLEQIDISKNQFDVFPLVLTRVESLKILIANRNAFDRLPESIGYNQKLEIIDLWDTPVMIFPESFYSLPQLKKLDLSGIRYSPTFQEKLKIRLPNTEIILDAPCDCME
jgi:Leucine-rich repeat (LRR) protein